jgi:hypothetical protein
MLIHTWRHELLSKSLGINILYLSLTILIFYLRRRVKEKAYRNNQHILKASLQYNQACKNLGRKIYVFVGKVVPELSQIRTAP